MLDSIVNDLHVTQINRSYYDSGATCPILCTLSDGRLAVVKYVNNNERNRILVNEFLSAKFADALELNVPQSGICLLDNRCSLSDEMEHLKKDAIFEITSDNYGVAFFSSYIPRSTPVLSPMVSRVINRKDFVRMIIFDHIIYNTDRHEGNILLSNSRPLVFYLIDHSHVFKNQAIWNAQTFIQGMNENDFCDTIILQKNNHEYTKFFEVVEYTRDDIIAECNRDKELLTPDFVRQSIRKLPNEWLGEVTSRELTLLEEYISFRVSHLEDIGEMICEERGI